jgi:hypothetical protein
MRTLITVLAFVLPAMVSAQAATTPSGIVLGSRLRILTATRTHAIHGTLVAMLGDTLLVQTTDADVPGEPQDVIDQLRVPAGDVRRLFVQSGFEPRRRAVVRDAIGGAVLGAALSAIALALSSGVENVDYNQFDDHQRPSIFSEAPSKRFIALSASTLLVAGAIYGTVRRHARWIEIPTAAR